MRLRIPVIFAAILCLAAPAAGQGDLRDYGFVTGSDPYLYLSNPAAVAFWDGRIAVAGLSFDKQDGGLRDIDQSTDSWEVKAETESYCRISNLVSFYGKLSWKDFQGKDMGGQILMDPDYNPVNFLENKDTDTGTKKRELYTLKGQIGLSPWKKWRIGAGIDYQAGDQIKIKDPRFNNVWMDLGVSAGLFYSPSQRFSFGLSAIWRNTVEQVKGGIYGTTDKQYFIDTDKGGFYGTVAQLDGDFNYMPASTARPMINKWVGGALQAVIGNKYSGELSLATRRGSWGNKSSTTATFFEFSGYKAGYKGLLIIPGGRNLHRIQWNLGYEKLSNNENSFRYVTPEGGNTIVDYTGQNHILDRKVLNVGIDWRWHRGTEGGRPAFTVGLSADWNSMQQATEIYPFWRKQAIGQSDVSVFCQKNWISGRNIFTLDVSALGHTGYGTKKSDGSYASTTATSLRSFDIYLDRHYEAETAPRAGASLAFTYTVLAGKVFTPWIRLSDSYISLLKAPEYLEGSSRNSATITLGCNF
jgi:hypothetical protein